jgi:hypothetical protein
MGYGAPDGRHSNLGSFGLEALYPVIDQHLDQPKINVYHQFSLKIAYLNQLVDFFKKWIEQTNFYECLSSRKSMESNFKFHGKYIKLPRKTSGAKILGL